MVTCGSSDTRPTPPDDIKAWRKSQRERLISNRLTISNELRKSYAEAIIAALVQLVSTARGLIVSAYWPIRGEPDLRSFAEHVVEKGGCFALPVVAQKAQPLVFRTWRHGDLMERGFWNIPVPSAGVEVSPDVVISPLVGFDLDGYRLGYGGGYYDRTLASMERRPKVIGVGYETARLDTIHPQPHDIAMDMIVTEKGIATGRP